MLMEVIPQVVATVTGGQFTITIPKGLSIIEQASFLQYLMDAVEAAGRVAMGLPPKG
jgi:hypothetical protein